MITKITPCGPHLTEYVINLLQRHDILKLRDLLDADNAQVSKITNLPETTVAELKRTLIRRHGPSQRPLSQQYELDKSTNWTLPTGIEPLDQLLRNDTLSGGCVWEICGRSGIGKSQFCHTLALNFIIRSAHEALYIDTKLDFSGMRVHEMLRSRGFEKDECARLMHLLKVERTLSGTGVLDVLEQLQLAKSRDDEAVRRIKLVILDSLPAVWFVMRGDDNSVKGKVRLSHLAFLMHKLATQFKLAFLVVNIVVPVWDTNLDTDTQAASDNITTTQSTAESQKCATQKQSQMIPTYTSGREEFRAACGRYWNSVPHMQICMQLPVEQGDDSDEHKRMLRVTKSCFTPTGAHCYVSISDAGVA